MSDTLIRVCSKLTGGIVFQDPNGSIHIRNDDGELAVDRGKVDRGAIDVDVRVTELDELEGRLLEGHQGHTLGGVAQEDKILEDPEASRVRPDVEEADGKQTLVLFKRLGVELRQR